jgi:hypothetical protein
VSPRSLTRSCVDSTFPPCVALAPAATDLAAFRCAAAGVPNGRPRQDSKSRLSSRVSLALVGSVTAKGRELRSLRTQVRAVDRCTGRRPTAAGVDGGVDQLEGDCPSSSQPCAFPFVLLGGYSSNVTSRVTRSGRRCGTGPTPAPAASAGHNGRTASRTRWVAVWPGPAGAWFRSLGLCLGATRRRPRLCRASFDGCPVSRSG